MVDWIVILGIHICRRETSFHTNLRSTMYGKQVYVRSIAPCGRLEVRTGTRPYATST